LKGAALEWCQSLPAASIRSLAGFHTTFNSFCKDYYPAVRLFESCCEEFSSLHEASIGPEDHVHDKAFTVEERICCEKIEVLNDMSGVSSRMEASDIISDVSVLLDVHKDQHTSCGDYEFVKQMWSMVDGSPKCRVEADIPSNPVSEDGDLPVCKEDIIVEEVPSLFLQGVSHDIFSPKIKEKKIMYEQPEAAGPTVPETNIFDGITILEEDHKDKGQPLFDEYHSDDELQAYPTFDHYKHTEEPFGKQNSPMVPIYDEYESDLEESQQEEEKEPEGQSALRSEPVSKQPLPEINQPMIVVHPPVLTIDIQPHIHSCVAEEAAYHQFFGVCHWSYEPVKEYMELHFLHKLEPPHFISTSACKEGLKSVTIMMSWLHHLFEIIDKRKELPFRKLLDWLWWKFSFT
jgi:hypothetical protein